MWALAPALKKVCEIEKSLCFHDSSPYLVDFNELLDLPLYSADNADILQATLDGKSTLQMMGIICNFVKQGSMQHKPILKKYPTKEDLLKFAIPVKDTGKISKSQISVVLKPIKSFNIITGNENMVSMVSTEILGRSVYKCLAWLHASNYYKCRC